VRDRHRYFFDRSKPGFHVLEKLFHKRMLTDLLE
jgi:hypothetical protein